MEEPILVRIYSPEEELVRERARARRMRDAQRRKARYRALSGMKNRVFARDKYRCLKCGSRKDLTLDHVVPKSKGGSNGEENMQTLCGPCNREKADGPTIDYRRY